MAFLSVEMNPRKGADPVVPEEMKKRDDVTESQKKRLALWSRMGLGPGGVPLAANPSGSGIPDMADGQGLSGLALPETPMGKAPKSDKKTMLERERALREQREKEEEDEAEREKEAIRKKREEEKAKRRFGFAPLGPVLPREEVSPVRPATPAPPPAPPMPRPPRPPGAAGAQMKLSISASTVDRVVAATEPTQSEYALPGEPAEDRRDAKKSKKANKQVEQNQPKKAKKKKKKKKTQDSSDDEEEDTSEGDDEPAPPSGAAPKLPPNKSAQMYIESVKGKVSKANENLTDKDLERRFGSGSAPTPGLMTEEQALMMLMKERGKKKPESAAARVQREAQEWADAKKNRMARKRSRSGGRMVTSARGPNR